jgi:4-alpha-glucanotransferase/(1->4)-alpha-D-glucan 1-alpha-D-glucosylmutase
VTAVPRLIASLIPDASAPPLGASIWTDTRIELPPADLPPAFSNAFTGAMVEAEQDGESLFVSAARLFDCFPIALLTSRS